MFADDSTLTALYEGKLPVPHVVQDVVGGDYGCCVLLCTCLTATHIVEERGLKVALPEWWQIDFKEGADGGGGVTRSVKSVRVSV